MKFLIVLACLLAASWAERAEPQFENQQQILDFPYAKPDFSKGFAKPHHGHIDGHYADVNLPSLSYSGLNGHGPELGYEHDYDHDHGAVKLTRYFDSLSQTSTKGREVIVSAPAEHDFYKNGENESVPTEQ